MRDTKISIVSPGKWPSRARPSVIPCRDGRRRMRSRCLDRRRQPSSHARSKKPRVEQRIGDRPLFSVVTASAHSQSKREVPPRAWIRCGRISRQRRVTTSASISSRRQARAGRRRCLGDPRHVGDAQSGARSAPCASIANRTFAETHRRVHWASCALKPADRMFARHRRMSPLFHEHLVHTGCDHVVL